MTDTHKKKPRRSLLKPVPDDAYANRQLNLFQEFLANTVNDSNALSNAIDLWSGNPTGETAEYYPGAREELIEHALRKMAVEQYAGFFDKTDFRSSTTNA